MKVISLQNSQRIYVVKVKLVNELVQKNGIRITSYDFPSHRGLDTLIFFYKHNNYKHTYGKKCEK